MNKKIITILLVLVIGAAGVMAQVYEPALRNYSPKIMAQGGSFAGANGGFDALFSNPAMMPMGRGELYLVGMVPNFKIEPISIATDAADTGLVSYISDNLIDVALGQVTKQTVGAGANIGALGFVGKYFGIGTLAAVGVDLPKVSSIDNVSVNVYADFALNIGLGIPVIQGDELTVSVGADLRPMVRAKVSGDLTLVEAFTAADADPMAVLSDYPAQFGSTVAMDLGAAVKWRSLMGSVVIRDLGNTTFNYTDTTLNNLGASEDPLGVIFGGDTSVNNVTPSEMKIGFAFDPKIPLVDPKIHAEYSIPLGDFSDLEGYSVKKTFLANLKAGAEVTVLGLVDVRAGINSGYVSAGVGLDLLIAEINLSLYSLEQGVVVGQSQEMAASMEVAIRL